MSNGDWVERATAMAMGVRRRAVVIAQRQSGGYLAQACGSAEILIALYTRLMRLDSPSGPGMPGSYVEGPASEDTSGWGGRYNGLGGDRFVLSPAHYATALYATLVEVGRLDERALDTFAMDGSALEMIGAEYSPGIELTSGSLGQALSVAVGRALARQRRRHPGRFWVLMSDGEFQEGQTWEAFLVAGHHRLANLTVFLDANGYQVDGPLADTLTIEPMADKAAAFGWDVSEVDGHDLRALVDAGQRSGVRPALVICRTEPWHGIPSLRSRHPRKLHFIRFLPGEAERAWLDLGA